MLANNKYKNTKINHMEMQFDKKEYKKPSRENFTSFIFGGDIGGTNTSFGIFGVKNNNHNNPELLASFHFKTEKIKAMHHAVNEVMDYMQKNYNIEIANACFAAAGVLSADRDYAKITNAKLDISKNVLLRETGLKHITIINDFESVGYGISMLAENEIIAVKKAKKIPKAPILVIGAGTGLGKTALIYDVHSESYFPIPSEAGHSDFPPQNELELELVNFIKTRKKIRQSISYEQVCSGQGLSNIYFFLRKKKVFNETKCTKEIDKSKGMPELISKYRKIDKTCRAAFEMFIEFYARFAKNFALDCMAFGGVYIAGGISQKNRDIFGKDFAEAFEKNHKLRHVLKKIPVYLILNPNAGLLGAGFCGADSSKK